MLGKLASGLVTGVSYMVVELQSQIDVILKDVPNQLEKVVPQVILLQGKLFKLLLNPYEFFRAFLYLLEKSLT